MAQAASVQDWQARFRGRLLRSGDQGYDEARRVWNGMIDRRPAVIARCLGTADVIEAVRLAREQNLLVSVRGGGHNVGGNAVCDDGLMIDLTLLKGIRVDPEVGVAYAQPGLLWREFDHETQAFGLATTGGQVSHTGIAGLTLGGGLGWLMGKHGATCDNLLSADVVTADGGLLEASPTQNPDLYWAIRGGGGNFGIVTLFQYQLHPVGNIFAGLLVYPQAKAKEILRFYRDFLAATPDELITAAVLMRSPDGQPVLTIVVVYCGPPQEGERVLRPLREFGPPLADQLATMPYVQAQRMADPLVPIGNRYYWKSNFLDSVADGLIDVLIEGANAAPSPHSLILLFEIKGAIRRLDRDEAAFDHRNVGHEMSIIANWTDPVADDANIAWTRRIWEAAQPFVSGGVYVNHMTADESRQRLIAAYGAGKYDRLAAIKKKYDPTNFFRMNQNIAPASH